MTSRSDRPSRCEIWGVVNVTPDSFSDGGQFLDAAAAVEQGLQLARWGADVLDIGGQSTRPRGNAYGDGYEELSESEELARVLPVVERLARETRARISIDTQKGGVAEAAVAAGAKIINDVSGGSDPHLLAVAAKCPVDLVLMHNRGRGEVEGTNTRYDHVTRDVGCELQLAAARAMKVGVAREQIWLDPGIGFAKTADQSLQLLNSLADLRAVGYRVLVGASRKSLIAAAASRSASPAERLGGSLAIALHARSNGADAVRVHDVFETRQAFDVADAIGRAAPRGAGG